MTGQRKLAALLLTDIDDFARALGADKSAALSMLHHRNVIVNAAARKHGGKTLRSTGDRFRVLFDSALSAVECASLIRELVSDYNDRRASGQELRVRLAVHLSDVVLDGGDIFGEGVETAARLLASARPGGIRVSGEVFAMIRGSARDPFISLGKQDIGGGPEPLEIFEDSAGKATPAAASSDGPVHLVAREEPEGPPQAPVSVPEASSFIDKKLDHSPPRERPQKKAAEISKRRRQLPPARPITDAILSISHRSLMTQRLAGLTILERQLYTLHRAGIRRVWITAERLHGRLLMRMRRPKSLEVLWMSVSSTLRNKARPPYATISADHLLRVRVLRDILRYPHKKPTSYQDPARKGDFDKKGIIQIIPYGSDEAEAYAKRDLRPADFLLLKDLNESHSAMTWLLDSARKSTDSFMAKNFDRRISLAVTRRLLDTRIRPNQMTVLSSAIGLAGALLLAGGSYPCLVAGTLIIWLHTLLDGCDGELARIRFQESRLGGRLDFWGDNIIHAALFTGLGVGRYRLTGTPVPLILGLTAAAGAVLSALAIYRFSVEKSAAGDGGPFFQGLEGLSPKRGAGVLVRLLTKVEHTLSQRDFIYLLVILALADRMTLFLWLAGIGTPLFLFVFLGLRGLSALKKS